MNAVQAMKAAWCGSVFQMSRIDYVKDLLLFEQHAYILVSVDDFSIVPSFGQSLACLSISYISSEPMS